MTRSFIAHIKPSIDLRKLSRHIKDFIHSDICDIRGHWQDRGLVLSLSKEYCQGVRITLTIERIGRIKKVRPYKRPRHWSRGISFTDYEFCPHCHGSFSFQKLGPDFICGWCKKDVRTSTRLA